MKIRNKKVIGLVAVAALTLGSAGVAFAYFTSTGSGTGSASTGSSTNLTIAQTNTVSGLLPGGPSETIDYTVTNPGTGAEYVGAVTTTVTAVTSGTLTSEACATTMYVITNGPALNTDLAAGATVSGTATISLTDDGANQDNCEATNSGGAVTLAFASN